MFVPPVKVILIGSTKTPITNGTNASHYIMSEADIHFEFYRHLANAIDDKPQRDGLVFGDVRAEYSENIDGFADIVLFDTNENPAVVIEAKAPNGSGRSRQEIDPYAPA